MLTSDSGFHYQTLKIDSSVKSGILRYGLFSGGRKATSYPGLSRCNLEGEVLDTIWEEEQMDKKFSNKYYKAWRTS